MLSRRVRRKFLNTCKFTPIITPIDTPAIPADFYKSKNRTEQNVPISNITKRGLNPKYQLAKAGDIFKKWRESENVKIILH